MASGLPTADFIPLNAVEDLDRVTVFPQIIKPALEGSSFGIHIVYSKDELRARYKELVPQFSHLFVETYIKGREITVSLMDNHVYPILELVPKNVFYDFEAKYTQGMTQFILPAPLTKALEQTINQLAIKAYDVVGCRGAVRVDMMIDANNNPFILELNTIPGMSDRSDLPAQANAAGIEFPLLIQKIIDASL